MFTNDRRQHKRHIVHGEAAVQLPDGSSSKLEVLNLSRGGLLLLTSSPPPIGSDVTLNFSVQGYHSTMESSARVVRHDKGAMGVAFKSAPKGIEELLNWLETEWMLDILK